jgi:hypothetical protein
MTLQAKLIAWLASVAAVLAVLYGAYHYGRHVQGMEDDTARQKAVITQQQKDQVDILAYAESLKTAGEQHDVNQSIIDSLHDHIEHDNGLRIHIPGCSASAGVAKTAVGGNAASGVLPDTVDAAFADLQGAAGQLIKRCDQLNVDAIRLNSEVK